MTDLPGITLRSVQADDLSALVRLDRLSFAPLRSDAEVEQEWYGQGVDLPGRKLFLAVDDQTGLGVGTYAQLDLQISLQGIPVPAMGIAAVAVALERRGQRIAPFMLRHALQSAQAQQTPIAMLYPFQHGFYRKLGWAWVGRTYQYRVSTHHLPAYPERSQILPYNPSQHQHLLQSTYQEAAFQHHGWLHRQDWQWKSFFKPSKGREIYVYVENGKLSGYIVLQFALLEPPQNILAVIVREWVALTVSAYRGLVGFVASLRDQISTVVWNTDEQDSFPYLLKEQRRDSALSKIPFEFGLTHPFGEIGGGFMWRLVDLEAAFRLRSIQAGPSFTLMFQVSDPVLGDRTITVKFEKGEMLLVSEPAEAIIKTSIEHLTELFSGFRSATSLLWTGELEIEGDASLLKLLDTAWRTTPPFCWDFF